MVSKVQEIENDGPTRENNAQIQAKIITQSALSVSFQNPQTHKLALGVGNQPKLKIEVNASGQHIEGDLYESALELKATATSDLGMIYDLKITYGGIIKIETIPDGALEPFLLISGPTMIFPFLRRLVADVTREGGFPPLLLDPIDFSALYMQRQRQRRREALVENQIAQTHKSST